MKKMVYLGLVSVLAIGTYSFVSAQNNDLDKDKKIYKNTKIEAVKLTDSSIKSTEVKEVVENNKQKSIEITTKEIISKNEIIDIDLQIPVINNLENEKIQSKINKILYKEAVELKNEIEKMAQNDSEEFKKQGWSFRPYMVNTRYEVSYNKKDILSLSVVYWQYTGGAHGNYNKAAYNFDLKTGKLISLKDLFKEGVKYKEIITQEIKNQMQTEPEKYFIDEIDKLEVISDDKPFNIEDEGIVIYYQTYEIAPYSSGIPEFKIPFSLFKDDLKENFK